MKQILEEIRLRGGQVSQVRSAPRFTLHAHFAEILAATKSEAKAKARLARLGKVGHVEVGTTHTAHKEPHELPYLFELRSKSNTGTKLLKMLLLPSRRRARA